MRFMRDGLVILPITNCDFTAVPRLFGRTSAELGRALAKLDRALANLCPETRPSVAALAVLGRRRSIGGPRSITKLMTMSCPHR